MKKDHLLEEYLKSLRLSTILREYSKVAKEAARNNSGYEEFLLTLIEQEVLTREANGIKRRIKQAGFPKEKGLDDFDFSSLPSLNKNKFLALYRSGEYIRGGENVVLIGNNGTGKTHLAICLGQEACRQGKRVSFKTAAGLVTSLIEAQDEKRLLKCERQLKAVDLLIIDELGYIPLTQPGAQLLFGVFAQRYEQGSILVTTNLEFGEWTKVFGDEKLTSALLDRLTHRCEIFLMNGESYRFRESQRRLKKRSEG
jgi:DNA replication protein DnaC